MTTPALLPPRQFGFWTGTFVVVASMIGAGILTTSGFTLTATGNPTALLALWIIGGLMALCGAFTIAELATALPQAGGDYLFVREGFGRGAGFVTGWATFVLGFCGPTAVVARIAVSYFSAAFAGYFPNGLPGWVVPAGATTIIAFVTVAHCFGQSASGRFQVAITTVKFALLLSLGAGGLLFGTGDWGHLSAGHWPTTAQWPALATGLIYVSYAYSGWNAAAYLAGEIRDPARLLPRTLLTGTLTVTALYLLVNFAYVFALNPATMTALSFDDPAVQKVAETAVVKMFGQQVANVFGVLISLSLLASVSAYVLTGPRVTFAMARDGYFPAFAARLHPRRGIPVWATLAQGGVAAMFIWTPSLEDLLDYVSVGLAAASGLVVASIFPLRRRGIRGTFRVPLYPLPPLLYLALIIWSIVAQVLDPEKRLFALLSLGTIAAGIPLAGRLARRPAPGSTHPPS
ncbi:MAG: APC family permease [Fimbriiglobus sp.]|nr:APC family permease [Fimbriiglobus sp.]